ncbi:MAG: restriction endonuclease subunit S [Christensenellales bacterium]|nr:restriction endonuclease subunit S [Christensenellales bacterium]
MTSEWNHFALGEITELVIDYRGKTPKKLGGDWCKQGYRALSAKNIKTGRIVQAETIRYIDESLYRKWMKDEVQRGDILITSEAPFGQIFFWDSDEKIVLSQRLFCVRIKPEYDARFIYYYMTTPEFQSELDGRATGTTVIGLRQPELMKCIIRCPEIQEQKVIAAILSSIDAKIIANEKVNDNLEQQAASIFAEWLNTCADFSTIGDMAHNILDYSPIASEKIRLLNSSDITEGVFPVAPLVPNKDLKGHFKKRFQFGDILYSEIRPRNHHYGVVLFDASDYIASTRLMVIRAIENKVSPAMLYQYLLLPEVEAEFTLKTESRSGTFPQGNYADMASIQVPYSPTDSQTAVSETLSQIRYTIAQNQLESQRLAELRDTLLPKLMSGELDVSAVQL